MYITIYIYIHIYKRHISAYTRYLAKCGARCFNVCVYLSVYVSMYSTRLQATHSAKEPYIFCKRDLRLCKRALYIPQKSPISSAKELYDSAKEACVYLFHTSTGHELMSGLPLRNRNRRRRIRSQQIGQSTSFCKQVHTCLFGRVVGLFCRRYRTLLRNV